MVMKELASFIFLSCIFLFFLLPEIFIHEESVTHILCVTALVVWNLFPSSLKPLICRSDCLWQAIWLKPSQWVSLGLLWRTSWEDDYTSGSMWSSLKCCTEEDKTLVYCLGLESNHIWSSLSSEHFTFTHLS